jgi:hypothetical protein
MSELEQTPQGHAFKDLKRIGLSASDPKVWANIRVFLPVYV